MKLIIEKDPNKENGISTYMMTPSDRTPIVPTLMTIACSRLNYDNIEHAAIFDIAFITTRKCWNDSAKLYERLHEEADKRKNVMYTLSFMDIDDSVTSDDIMNHIHEGAIDYLTTRDDDTRRPFDIVIWDDILTCGIVESAEYPKASESRNVVNNYALMTKISKELNIPVVTCYKLSTGDEALEELVFKASDNIYQNVPE